MDSHKNTKSRKRSVATKTRKRETKNGRHENTKARNGKQATKTRKRETNNSAKTQGDHDVIRLEQFSRVGVISDTHGLLRPEAVESLRGCGLIVHAGDVGDAAVLDQLRLIAPTVAVRGNVDTGVWAKALPLTRTVRIGDLRLFVVHELSRLSIDPHASGFAAVIFGHSHRPSTEVKDGVLYLNPGAAGPRRFSLPITLATLSIVNQRLAHEIVTLHV